MFGVIFDGTEDAAAAVSTIRNIRTEFLVCIRMRPGRMTFGGHGGREEGRNLI